MEQTLDLLLTILPFEPQYFDATKLKTLYVGNPLVEALEPTEEEPSWAPPHNTPFLTIFPGSRETEITRNLPLQLAVAEETKLPIAISCSHEKFFPLIQKISGNSFPIIKPEHTKNLLKTTSFAIATSGTICLELALHNVPTVCSFAIRPLDQFIATKIFKINLPYYCIANIIANKEIFPEYFGSNLTFQSLLNGVQKIINGTHHCETNIVRTLLGEKRTSEEASSAILSTIKI